MTGFTQTEQKLGRLVAKAIELGTPKEAFGILDGDTRSVGPRVTLQVNKLGQPVYVVNSTNGLTLGRTYAEAHNAIVRTHKASLQPKVEEQGVFVNGQIYTLPIVSRSAK